MTARGTGDEGAAIDLLPLAEVPLGPSIDWKRLAYALAHAKATTDPAQQRRLIEAATELAQGQSGALALVKMTVDRLAASAT